MQRWNNVAIIGVGLIGGSIGLALRERGLAERVVGIGRRQANLNKANQLGAIPGAWLKARQGVVDADLVIVCTPVSLIASQFLEAAAVAPEEARLPDAGRTRGTIVANVEAQLPQGKRFVGTHPLAGSEKSGVEFAKP